MNNQTINSGKTTATVAYMTLIGALIAISMNGDTKNPFARDHCQQAFGLHLCFHILAISMTYWAMSWLRIFLYVTYLGYLGYSLIQVHKGNLVKVPLLGEKFKLWFTFIR